MTATQYAPASSATPAPERPLLEIQDLHTHFFTSDGVVKAVDGVDLTIPRGKTLGLVGESGCGKSVTALSIMRLIQTPPGKIVGGRITFEGQDLLALPEGAMNKMRGSRISMIFQEPMTSLNPLHKVGDQIAEAVKLHESVSDRAARDRAVQMLRQVGIPSPEQRAKNYPNELSGGMRQRVMIAIALACRPALLIADEPTTALDVTIQAQILDLLKALQTDLGMSLLLITHDLGVVAETADEVAVMYAGKVVEHAPVVQLFQDPKHPYTQGLLASIPTLDSDRNERLTVIRGSVPNLTRLPSGCVFNPRCPHVMDICHQTVPALLAAGPEQTVRCWLYHSEAEAAAQREVSTHVGPN